MWAVIAGFSQCINKHFTFFIFPHYDSKDEFPKPTDWLTLAKASFVYSKDYFEGLFRAGIGLHTIVQ
jgi:hypothetical protein